MNKKKFIDHLSKKEKDEFISEIVTCTPNKKSIQEIISSWQATAEINSNPRVKKQILSRKKKLDRYLIQLKNG